MTVSRISRNRTRDTRNFAVELETPDANYRAGVELFNSGEYFDAHEVWEEFWGECPATERRFIQALIQAAVAVYHFQRGNHTGAARLFHSGRRYMEPYRPSHRGLDVDAFWRQVEAHLAEHLKSPDNLGIDKELRLRNSAGEWVWLRARAQIVRDGDNAERHLVGIAVDISAEVANADRASTTTTR